jgi:cytochrome c oxidase assembly protein subunit 11
MGLRQTNLLMLRKLVVVALGMFGFGYALVPLYVAICEATGINILALGEKELPGSGNARLATPQNSQLDTSRTITVASRGELSEPAARSEIMGLMRGGTDG